MMELGYTSDDAAGESISVLAQAAMAGDKRVIVESPSTWQPMRRARR
jgi:hypothetical protein